MCLTVPGQVIAIDELGASVQIGDRVRRAMSIFVPEIAVGDWVILSAGSILRVLDPEEAQLIRDTILEAAALEDAERASAAELAAGA